MMVIDPGEVHRRAGGARRRKRTLPRAAWLLLVLLGAALRADAASPAADTAGALSTAVAGTLDQLTAERADEVVQLARSLEIAFAMQASFVGLTKPLEFVARIDELHVLHKSVEEAVTKVFAARGQFAALPDAPERREKIRAFLKIASSLIDLSARMRYTLFDATADAAYELEPQSAEMRQLITVLTKHRSSIGASAIIDELFIPPASNRPAAEGRPRAGGPTIEAWARCDAPNASLT